MIVISVCSAIIVILILATAGYYWAKRTGKIKSTPHRTLTSFENPVYEYEHNINAMTSNPIDKTDP